MGCDQLLTIVPRKRLAHIGRNADFTGLPG